ncbi:MAG: hypothetical protein APR63_15070 [Desulfuromonas sp. SDB]|nr:MAG: hypothetical protein APR63_15070 [Desulfuromonas sp. SDB]
MKKMMILNMLMVFPMLIIAQAWEEQGQVDLNLTSTYGLISVGSGFSAYPEPIPDQLQQVRDSLSLSNYSTSLSLGFYMPWLSKRSLLGLRTDFYYDRFYHDQYWGRGATFETIGITGGIDYQQWFGSRSGRGPFIHFGGGLSKIKYSSTIGYSGFTDWGYGLSGGGGYGFPLKLIPGLESTAVCFDYQFRKFGEENFSYFNFNICFGGYF